ncbi:MAG: acetate--CoA ligase [Acidobacteria bacterium]|uniref:acetate--CoA ligase n=1 Tax=Candidatus Polarisedimenticola svalbardensis TaxID=2886004 RepID=A0A8J6Y7L7_9BACT|nr:acetate--CoA ligase [Candidatus Polarisedimenticola svalbardensis]
MSSKLHWNDALGDLDLTADGPINIGYLCTDRNVEKGLGAKTALIHQGHGGVLKIYTFTDLKELSGGWAAFLESRGIGSLDRVCLFLDRAPELYIGFLGILKLGAVVQPLFSAFGDESLISRMEDSGAAAIITQRKHLGKVRKVRDRLTELKTVVVIDQTENNKPLRDGEIAFDMETGRTAGFVPAPTVAESPSVLHYTSGTTGKPKGALHVHGSVLAQYLTSRDVLDLKSEDVYWCTADPGWVTGTSYGIIGPWTLGCTQFVLDAGFSSAAWYQVMADHKVSVWYTAPTAIRMLMKDGIDLVKDYDLSSLRHMCSVGEPLNAEGVLWGREAFGLDFHDTFWQTETGAMMITNMPGMAVKPGSMGKPYPALEAAVVDAQTGIKIDEPNTVGMIAVKPPWPSMMRTYWNNSATFYGKFLGGWYICGDRASIDKDGYFWFSGRDDDVINTGGHLVGPFEIESALLEHEAVAESAAIGKPDPVNMEVVKAFVALKPGFEPDDDMELSIMNFIRKKLSPLAMPQEIEFMDKLPKTRSGKIVRRMLKAMERGEEIGDTSTLDDD